MIAVLIAANPTAGHAELLRQGDAFVTLRATPGSEDLRSLCRSGIDVWLDVVNPVTICADWRARYTASYGLAVYALIVLS